MGQERAEQGHVPTKLDLILQEIQGRSDLVLVGEPTHEYHEPYRGSLGGVTIYVAPSIPTADISKLRKIFRNFRKYKPSSYEPPHVSKLHEDRPSLWYGRANFPDRLARIETQITRSLTETHKEALRRIAPTIEVAGKKSTSSEIKRIIFLKVFPHVLIAQAVKDKGNQDLGNVPESEKYRLLSLYVNVPSLEGLVSGKFRTIEEMLTSEQ